MEPRWQKFPAFVKLGDVQYSAAESQKRFKPKKPIGLTARQKLSNLIQCLAVSETQRLHLASKIDKITLEKDELDSKLKEILKESNMLHINKDREIETELRKMEVEKLLKDKEADIESLKSKISIMESEIKGQQGKNDGDFLSVKEMVVEIKQEFKTFVKSMPEISNSLNKLEIIEKEVSESIQKVLQAVSQPVVSPIVSQTIPTTQPLFSQPMESKVEVKPVATTIVPPAQIVSRVPIVSTSTLPPAHIVTGTAVTQSIPQPENKGKKKDTCKITPAIEVLKDAFSNSDDPTSTSLNSTKDIPSLESILRRILRTRKVHYEDQNNKSESSIEFQNDFNHFKNTKGKYSVSDNKKDAATSPLTERQYLFQQRENQIPQKLKKKKKRDISQSFIDVRKPHKTEPIDQSVSCSCPHSAISWVCPGCVSETTSSSIKQKGTKKYEEKGSIFGQRLKEKIHGNRHRDQSILFENDTSMITSLIDIVSNLDQIDNADVEPFDDMDDLINSLNGI